MIELYNKYYYNFYQYKIDFLFFYFFKNNYVIQINKNYLSIVLLKYLHYLKYI